MEYTHTKDLCIDRELSQEQVARHLKIATRTYSEYENGSRNIPVPYIYVYILY